MEEINLTEKFTITCYGILKKVQNSPYVAIKSKSSQKYLDGRVKGYFNPLLSYRTPNEKDLPLLWTIQQHKTNDDIFFLVGSGYYLNGRSLLIIRDPNAEDDGKHHKQS